MNIIKYTIVFIGLVLCFEQVALQGMERWSLDTNETSNNPVQHNQTQKKKRRKRKNKNAPTQATTPEQTQEISISKLPRYSDASELARVHATGLTNIPMCLGITSLKTKKEIEAYLEKLHILTNILTLLEELSNHVQNIAALDNKALRTTHRLHPIKGLVYHDNAILLDDNEDGCVIVDADKKKILLPDSYFLASSAAKAATIQANNLQKSYQIKLKSILEDTTKTSAVKAKLLNKITLKEFVVMAQFLKALDISLHHELPIVSNWFKNTLAQQKRSLAIKDLVPLTDIIVFMNAHTSFATIPLVTTDHCFIPNLIKIIDEKRTVEIFEDWLENLRPFVQTHIPHIFNLLEVIELIIKSSHVLDLQDEYFDFKQNSAFNLIINHLLSSLKENEQNYKKLYSRLREEQKRFFANKEYSWRLAWLKKYTTTVLITSKDGQPLPKEIFAQEKNYEKEYDWLSAAKAFQEKQKKINQQLQTKNQQKKAAKRKNQRTSQHHASGQKEEEDNDYDEGIPAFVEDDSLSSCEQSTRAPDFHLYDYRCLRWFFDQDFLARNNFDRKKLLKHTFDFACDDFIFKYGVQKPWHNATHPGQIDTAYYLGGEICHPDGKRETVLFVCTKDPQGICYHRGVEVKDQTLFAEFERNKFEYDFPSYYLELPSEQKTIEFGINDALYSKTCVENQFYSTIKDVRNGVTLILFKPNFQSHTIS